MGNHELAIGALKSATAIGPDNAYAYYYMGQQLDRLKRYPEAIDAYKSAIAIKPDVQPSFLTASKHLPPQTRDNGSVTVTGAGSTWENKENSPLSVWSLRVGDGGTGQLTVSGGGQVTNSYGYIGSQAGSDGTAIVMGAGSTWTNSSNLDVGDFGQGQLTVSNGGRVTSTDGRIGLRAGSIGTVAVGGPGSTWTNSQNLVIDGTDVFEGGTGTLQVNPGGTVTVAGTIRIRADGTLQLDGGTIVADDPHLCQSQCTRLGLWCVIVG